MTENARQVLVRRYVRRDQDGKPAESVEEMFWRVAYHVARVEESLGRGCHRSAPTSFTPCLTEKALLPQFTYLYRGWYAVGPAGCLLCAAHRR